MAGEKTYYWDDIKFGGLVNVENLEASAAGIQVYPNPATDFCAIELPSSLQGTARLSILDASGKLVKAVTLSQQNTALDLAGFNDGVYYLRIEKDAKAYFQKLVVVR